MFALSRYFVFTLTACAIFSVTAGAAQAKQSKLKITPAVSSAEVGDYKTFKVKGAVRRCQVKVGSTSVRSSFSRKRGASFYWSFDAPGTDRFSVKCGSKRLSFSVAVNETDGGGDSSEPNPGDSTPPTQPPAKRLTGSDAEAQEHWLLVDQSFQRIDRGHCADYAYSRRPDIPERVEKAAYKQWVADGAPIRDYSDNLTGKIGTEVWEFIDQRFTYSNWGALQTNDPRNAWVAGARRAGLTVDHIPHPGDIEVRYNHVAYVERVYSVTQGGLTTLHYEYTSMRSSNPGVVYRGDSPISESDFRAAGTYFVG